MSVEIKNIHWLAGLLEGEGSFGFYNGGPLIQLNMCDYDIVEKAHKKLSCTSKILILNKEYTNHNTSYRITIQGSLAISWMFTLYSLMGKRRKNQITEAINKWKNHEALVSPQRYKGNITIVNGIKVCTIHGPVTGLNTRYSSNRRWIYCKGCYRPTKSQLIINR